MRWTRWNEFKKRRKARYDKLSTAAPVNTALPAITNGGNGLLLANRGTWDNYPTRFDVEWKIDGRTVEYGDSYYLPSGVDFDSVSLSVTATNDNGSTTVTDLVYALDNAGVMPSFAYATKKLSSTYNGPALRVVRASDSTTLDIGFIGQDLDEAALLAFISGTTGAVDIWYDQSGHGNHATQTSS